MQEARVWKRVEAVRAGYTSTRRGSGVRATGSLKGVRPAHILLKTENGQEMKGWERNRKQKQTGQDTLALQHHRVVEMDGRAMGKR